MDSPAMLEKRVLGNDNDATSLPSKKKDAGSTTEMVEEVELVRSADRTKRTLKVCPTGAKLCGETVDIFRNTEPAYPAYRDRRYAVSSSNEANIRSQAGIFLY